MEKVRQSNYMMMLGGFEFSVSSAAFDKLSYNTTYRWKSHDTATDKNSPVMQFIGIGDQTMELEGTIYPQLVRDGLHQLDKMRAEAVKGQPLKLAYVEDKGKSSPNVGRVIGDFVIESINETRTLFLNDGIPREIQFTMRLKRYDGSEGK
ncbi:hypothetical protein CWB72_10475 [Pseudoalteromonas phenolica]|uniref:phage tail protein n=1 Tax=Pseudoalteromonas phenolica TaxID=161398 RepID=UPI00110B92B8|nr:phage tail protein [Pseudoalteromonas phenolica]TMN89453.1 hypothetical protein CWB72_10475 [Pseudoalteromonas phenolica]